jgi:hypothetical protein
MPGGKLPELFGAIRSISIFLSCSDIFFLLSTVKVLHKKSVYLIINPRACSLNKISDCAMLLASPLFS